MLPTITIAAACPPPFDQPPYVLNDYGVCVVDSASCEFGYFQGACAPKPISTTTMPIVTLPATPDDGVPDCPFGWFQGSCLISPPGVDPTTIVTAPSDPAAPVPANVGQLIVDVTTVPAPEATAPSSTTEPVAIVAQPPIQARLELPATGGELGFAGMGLLLVAVGWILRRLVN
jgi:hypothetical protein